MAKRATYPYLPTTPQVRWIIVPQHSKCLPRSKSPPRGQTHALVPTCKSLPALFLPFISIEMRRSSTLRQRFFRYLPYNGYLSSLLSTDETFYGIPRTFVMQPPCDMQPLRNNYISQDKPRRNSWWQIHMEPAHFISQHHLGYGYRKSDCLTGREMKILSQATNPTPTKIYRLILNKNQTYKNLPNSSKLFSNQFQVLYKLTYSRVVGFWISIGN